MRYQVIRKMDISNGPGIRVSIFMQGCPFHCPNCFNPETHDFKGGKEFTQETILHLLELANKEHFSGLSILGGEPLHEENRKGTIDLAKAFKERYPNKTVWVWTGYLYEQLLNQEEFSFFDYLVDGPFIEKEHDFRLMFRGSKNQRIIDIKKTLQNKKIFTLTEEEVKKLSV